MVRTVLTQAKGSSRCLLIICAETMRLLRSLLLELLHVEVELITLQDVSVGSAGLAGSRADSSQESSGLELLGKSLLEDSLGVSGSHLSLDVARLLHGLSLNGGGTGLLGQVNTVVLHVPLSERSGIDLNNGVLGQGLGTDQLLVGSVVNSIQDSGLVGSVLTGPDEVTGVQSHGAELHVTTSASNGMDSLVSDLSVSSGSAELELSLLLVNVSSTTRSSTQGG